MNLLTESARLWLSRLLQERFGVEFAILHENKAMRLVFVDKPDKYILFPILNSSFLRTNPNMPFTSWDASGEGWKGVLDASIPAPGVNALPAPLIRERAGHFEINYDILGLCYWMLNRIEEIGRTDLDEHGRFPAKASHALKHGYLERPIVDEWLHILGQVIQRVWPGIVLKKHQFSMKVSHDVDEPSRYGFRNTFGLIRAMGSDVLKRRAFKDAFFAPWIRMNTQERIHPLDPYNTFDWLMDLSERHGLTSAFYFTCIHHGTAFDADYDLDHPAIRNLMRHIHGRGHEIGLHPGYGTYLNPAQIKREAAHLRQVCAEEGVYQDQWGGRMHYLQWRQPITLRAWNDAGMTYDSSLTYADHAGFRCGTCFEYPAFDPIAQERLNLRIRPLIVMEGSVFGDDYMNLGVSEAARDKIMQLKDTCRMVSGYFTLLWHNSGFETVEEQRLYEKVL